MALAVVFQIGSLGDSIVSVPSLLSLRELLPNCSEYLLISGFQGDVKVHPSHIFDMAWPAQYRLNYRSQGNPLQRALSIAEVLVRLRYYRPQYGIYLLPSDRLQHQVARDRSFFRAGGVRELVGFRTLTDTERPLTEQISKYTTESFLRFRRLWNHEAEDKFDRYCPTPLLSPPQAAIEVVKTWLEKNRRHPARGLVAICPFSNASARDLHPSTVVSLTKRLESELKVEVILLGGAKDHPRMEGIRAEAGAGLNACGAFTPEQSAALFGESVLAVCVDSGPLHLAGAVDLPTVSAYATINKPFHKFLPLGDDHTILYQRVSCAGCGLTECTVDGHPCMSQTTVDQLFGAIRAKLTNGVVSHFPFHGTQLLEWPSAVRKARAVGSSAS